MTAIDDTLPKVGPTWETARAIHQRVGWAKQSIKAALDEAFRRGLIERRAVPIPSGVQYEYRRTVP